jgi:hypothetical protein
MLSKDPLLVDPLLVYPLLVDPFLVDPLLVDPLLVDPLLVDPLIRCDALVEMKRGIFIVRMIVNRMSRVLTLRGWNSWRGHDRRLQQVS